MVELTQINQEVSHPGLHCEFQAHLEYRLPSWERGRERGREGGSKRRKNGWDEWAMEICNSSLMLQTGFVSTSWEGMDISSMLAQIRTKVLMNIQRWLVKLMNKVSSQIYHDFSHTSYYLRGLFFLLLFLLPPL